MNFLTDITGSASFLFKSALRMLTGSDKSCPNCDSKKYRIVTKKYFIIHLYRCKRCKLMYRVPKQDPKENRKFYQNKYIEPLATELPNEEEIKELKRTKFRSSKKDFKKYIDVIKKRKKTGKLLDFGANWGNGVWQFRDAGYDAEGYEISKPRAKYGENNLDVKISTVIGSILNRKNHYDIIHTSHVLEHLTTINRYFRLFNQILKKGGLLFIYVPDCNGMENKKTAAKKKNYAFGKNHNFALDTQFLKKNLQETGFDVISAGKGTTNSELCVIAQKK